VAAPKGSLTPGDEAAVLRTLAEKLDVFQTLREFPELSANDLRRILLKASALVAEPVAAPQPAAKPRRETREPAAGAVWQLFSDGASKGNPGPAGAGYLLIDPEGEIVCEKAVPLGRATNNVAEYQALIFGLSEALDRGVARLKVHMDSQLIVRQISGRYEVKSPGLTTLYAKAKQLLSKFGWYDIVHVDRELNRAADALATQAAAAVSV
jgi:ribonuclease HI